MIRVQKREKFSGTKIYDSSCRSCYTDTVLVTRKKFYFDFFSLFVSPLPLRYQNSTLEAVVQREVKKYGKMKNAL